MVSKHLIKIFLLLSFCVVSASGAQRDVNRLFILGGELSNSAATSVEDVDEVMPRMAALGLNTVLVPAYWDLIEPVEGQYDWTLVDRVIDKARECKLQVVFLWFGVWKNSMSCYAPLWFKQDTKRFPRAMTKNGKPLEIASAFSENVFQADCKVFTKLMEHLAQKDPRKETVIMLQIENEIGMLEDARDHSPLAESFYRKSQYPNTLEGDEAFMAEHYARYVERLAQVARKFYDVPLYVNAAMNSRGRKPGEYPSAGPLAHLAPIWKKYAPSIDMLAPDIYDTGFKGWARQYALPDNPLFIPESRCCENSGVRALYSFGAFDAIGFSPFAIDQSPAEDTRHVSEAYGLIWQMKNYLQKAREKAWEKGRWQQDNGLWGVLFDHEDKEEMISDGNIVLTCRHYFTLPWDARAKADEWAEGGAIIYKVAQNEYLIAGSGVVVEFKTKSELRQENRITLGEDGFVDKGNEDLSSVSSAKEARWQGKRIGIGYVDQVKIDEVGNLIYIRRDNGDQDHQGRHARISVGDYKILHVKLYDY
jgi:hypothetical protein